MVVAIAVFFSSISNLAKSKFSRPSHDRFNLLRDDLFLFVTGLVLGCTYGFIVIALQILKGGCVVLSNVFRIYCCKMHATGRSPPMYYVEPG